jgi:hypothetical protein
VVTCETGADPAGGTDCANQFVEQEVAAVTLSQSAVAPSVWEPLHAAGVPTFWFPGGGDIAADDQSSFTIFNPEDVNHATAMGGYVAVASLLTSLEEISGEITVESIIDTIKSMPEAELPGGGGMTYQFGGSAAPELPAVCTNQSLRTQLDGEGQPTSYEVVDSTELVAEE